MHSTSGTRAVIYLRISHDRTGEREGVERQEADCRARIEREGWTLTEVYTDNDIGASDKSKKARPAYARMLADARSGSFDVIVSYSNSRLTRRMRELEDLIQLHEQTGVRIATCVSGDDNLGTADGRRMARIKASISAGEADDISERARRAHKARAEGGRMKVGRRPFGYDKTGHEVVGEEAELLREGIRRLIEGDSLRSIQRHFQASGVKTSMGKEWSVQSVRVVLARWRNAGVVVYRGEPVGEGDFPAIVSKEDQTLVFKILAEPTRKAFSYDTRPKHLLSNVMVCACGGPIRATSTDQYQCAAKYDTSINQAKADAYVLGRLAEQIAEDGVRADAGVTTRMREVQAELSRISDDERELAKSKVSVTLKLAMGEELVSEKAPLEAELVRLRQANALEAVAARLTPSPTTFGQKIGLILGNAQKVFQGLKELSIEDQRKVLAAKLHITLQPVGKGNKLSPMERILVEPIS